MYVVLAVRGFVELLRSAGAFEVVVATPPRMLPVPYDISAIREPSTVKAPCSVSVGLQSAGSVLTFFFHRPLPSGAKTTWPSFRAGLSM